MSRNETRSNALEALQLVGLDGLGSRRVTDLSGGQMQRVALARSLAMGPDILLLDEPLSNLDSKLRERLRHELKEIHQRLEVTTVYVTHDQDEALGLADRIVVLNDGSIAQAGSPAELFEEPATAFVGDFLGVSNQFDGDILDRTGGTVRMHLDGTDIELEGQLRAFAETARARCGIRPGSVLVEALRPDHDPNGRTMHRGTVLSMQYQGTHFRCHVRLAEGVEIIGTARSARGLSAGEPCMIAIAASAAHVWPEERQA